MSRLKGERIVRLVLHFLSVCGHLVTMHRIVPKSRDSNFMLMEFSRVSQKRTRHQKQRRVMAQKHQANLLKATLLRRGGRKDEGSNCRS
eukprot:981688-Amphidinium_carterae.1